MKAPLQLAAAALIAGARLAGAAHAEGADPTVTVAYPGKDWVFRFDLPGGVETYNNHKAGVSTYFSGLSVTQGINASVELVPGKGSRSEEECREMLMAPLRLRPEMPEFTQTKPGAHPRYEAFQAEYRGMALNQKHVHEVYLKGDVCAKLHLSKVKYGAQDEALFEAVFRSARFEALGADGGVTRSFLVARGETAQLTMPARWGFEREAPRKGMPLGLFLLEPAEDFKMGLRLVNAEAILRAEGQAAIRDFVAGARDKILPSAVEKQAELTELAGAAGTGYVYQVTNAVPVEQQKKGRDWRYFYQGAVPQGGYVLIFTIYANERDSADVRAGLQLARGLTLAAQAGAR